MKIAIFMDNTLKKLKLQMPRLSWKITVFGAEYRVQSTKKDDLPFDSLR